MKNSEYIEEQKTKVFLRIRRKQFIPAQYIDPKEGDPREVEGMIDDREPIQILSASWSLDIQFSGKLGHYSGAENVTLGEEATDEDIKSALAAKWGASTIPWLWEPDSIEPDEPEVEK